MRNKDEITTGFEETFSSIINSSVFKKYSEMKLGLNIREYSMLIKKDIKELLTIIKSTSHNSIVDIGCGTGDLIEFISKNTRAMCTGIDLSSKIIEILNQKKRMNLVYAVGDIEMGIEELFDIVICVDVLYFVENIEDALENLIHIINPDGICIIYYTDHHLLKNNEPIIERHLKSMKVEYSVSDITAHEEISWKSSLNAIEKFESEFTNEGLDELCETMKQEAIECLEKNIEYSTKRYRYIIKK
jgi:2-polyprenyl-3-methyl-5-hydroxy-6-metoxy-1,4-benzoquinol methylase